MASMKTFDILAKIYSVSGKRKTQSVQLVNHKAPSEIIARRLAMVCFRNLGYYTRSFSVVEEVKNDS